MLFFFFFSDDTEPLYSTISTMLSMDPIYVHHARNVHFSGVLYVGIYVGRLLAAEFHSLVQLPETVPYVGDAYIRLYNILVAVFGEQPFATFTDLFNAVRARAFESLQNECSVDVHFLPAPLPAVAITPASATVSTVGSIIPTEVEIPVANAVSVIQDTNTDHSYFAVEPVLADEPNVGYESFVANFINEPIAEISQSLTDALMDFDREPLLSPIDLDTFFDDVDVMLKHATDELSKK